MQGLLRLYLLFVGNIEQVVFQGYKLKKCDLSVILSSVKYIFDSSGGGTAV